MPYRHPKSVLFGGDTRGKSCVKKAKASSLGVTLDNVLIIILKSYMILQEYHLLFVYEYKINKKSRKLQMGF